MIALYDTTDDFTAKLSVDNIKAGSYEGVIEFDISLDKIYALGLYDADGNMLCALTVDDFSGNFTNSNNLPQSKGIDKTQVSKVVIPDGVTSIGNRAFSGCDNLTSVTIPNSITSIGICAFAGCTSLTSVTIPNSVTTIGNVAFGSCASLTSIVIPNSVTTIGSQTFYYCTSLTSVTIPDNVTSIGNSAFDCTSLTSVTYKGINYTSKSALTAALSANGVTYSQTSFYDVKLTN